MTPCKVTLLDLPVELLHSIFDSSSLTSTIALASTNHALRTFSSNYLESILARSFTDRRSYLVVTLPGNHILPLPSPQLIKGEYIISSTAQLDPCYIRGLALVVEIKDITLVFGSQLPFLNIAAQTNSLIDFNALVELSNSIGITNIFRRRMYLKMMFAGMGQNSVLEEVSFGFAAVVNI
jgi:hypothetical protein